LSGPLGVESLRPDEAAPLLDAYHEGVGALPGEFSGWAAAPLLDTDAAFATLTRRLDEGFAGLCLPAGALATPSAVERAGPLLALLEARGAPLHLERIAARGGPLASAFDPLLFYETSSYGPRMIDAMLRVVGVDQLVYGSDRPVVEPLVSPTFGPATWDALVRANPARLLAA
jgi:predicted TIM-barrel fold metal-dependent hydrolase